MLRLSLCLRLFKGVVELLSMQYRNSTSLQTLSLFLSKDNTTDQFDWQDALNEINKLTSLAAQYIEVTELRASEASVTSLIIK